MKRLRARPALTLAAAALPAAASAHGFGRLYNLPVPFWLYAWGAAAALLLSFLLMGLLAGAARPATAPSEQALRDGFWRRTLSSSLPGLRVLSVFLLLLTITTALWGNRDPFRNFSMTFFWVIFLLLGTYLTALIGNAYAVLNPWRLLCEALGRFWPSYARGRWRYPVALANWPALGLYLGFVWFELFSYSQPQKLGQLLLAYTAINVVAAGLVGIEAWFRHGEFFSVFLRLTGLMAPLHVQAATPSAPAALALRKPLAGLLRTRAAHWSTIAFALAMLSTTAFDGLRATQWWVNLFWRDPSGIVTALAGSRPILAYGELRPWYVAWESFWLFASPFLYLALYVSCIALAKALTRSTRSLRDLALDFGLTLLPIALVYHATHYATLLLTQGLKVLSLVSDPFGLGWDLFGTAWMFRAPILPGMGVVWHTQVGLILLGHVLSVCVAHLVALRVMPTRGKALLSQIPMLVFMVALTVAGLWILAQPLTTERLR